MNVNAQQNVLARMADTEHSEEMNEEFQREHNNHNDAAMNVAIHVNIVPRSSWQGPSTQLATKLKLPQEMERASAIFRSFYEGRCQDRRLDFELGSGTVDVVLTHGSQEFNVNMPTPCSSVVSLFQGSEEYTVDEIIHRTALPATDAIKAVAILSRSTRLHAPLLRVSTGNPYEDEHMTQVKPSAINTASCVRFNDAFQAKTAVVRISANNTSDDDRDEGEAEYFEEEAKSDLDTACKCQIDAACVRIIKARRSLHVETLVEEVISELKHRFTARPSDVMKQIEGLVAREYMEPNASNPNVYEYLP